MLGLTQNVSRYCELSNISFHYGSVSAAEQLGSCHKFGHFANRPHNATRAREAYQYGADRGDVAAKVALGQLYHFPRGGLERNVTRAIEL